jgi:tellurium resistance protein TerD
MLRHVVTHWTPGSRADLGLTASDLPAHRLIVTNRGWYLLRQFVSTAGGRSTDLMAGRDTYIPTALANHWGAVIMAVDPTDWMQVGQWNGISVVATGICRTSDIGLHRDTHELSNLADTPLHPWLCDIGMTLATAPTGVVITGKPTKGNLMAINLSKGGKVDLSKEAGGALTKVRIGLGWDVRRTDGPAYDLDASIIGLNSSGACASPEWFVFYNHMAAPGDVIVHQGDNLTGGGDGDDEQILIDLARVPADVTELVVAVTIHEAKARGGQNFGLVEDAFVRVVDETTNTELARYDLTEDTNAGVNSLVFGKLYRRGQAWNFRAIGDGFTSELQGLVTAYHIG